MVLSAAVVATTRAAAIVLTILAAVLATIFAPVFTAILAARRLVGNIPASRPLSAHLSGSP
jgi:hypothetical protein